MITVLSLWKGHIARRPTRREIAQEAARRHGLTFEELTSRSAAPRIAHPRQEAMFEMLCAGHTKADIARFFRLDRSCVYHASKAIPARLEAQAA